MIFYKLKRKISEQCAILLIEVIFMKIFKLLTENELAEISGGVPIDVHSFVVVDRLTDEGLVPLPHMIPLIAAIKSPELVAIRPKVGLE